MKYRMFCFLLLFFLIFSCDKKSGVDIINLEDKVRNLLELHTYEHIYRDIVYYGKQRSFLFVKTVDKSILFSINISVKAGIDFKEGFQLLREEQDESIIYVKLPPAKVLLVDADESTIHQYYAAETGSELGLKEYSAQLSKIKEKTKADAVARGILIKAEENAKRIIRNFLELAGFSEIEFITYTPPEEKGDME